MEVSIKGVLGIDSLNLVFKSLLNIIVGINEAGKTSIRDAIQWGLTGFARERKTHNEQSDLIRDGATAAEVTISQPSGKITRRKTLKSAPSVVGAVPKDEVMSAILCDPLTFLSYPENQRREFLFRIIPGLHPKQEDIGKRLRDWLAASEEPTSDLANLAVDDLAKLAATKTFKVAEDEAITRRRIARAIIKEVKLEEPKQRATIGEREYILPDIEEAQVIKQLEDCKKSRDELLQKKGKAAGQVDGEMNDLPDLQKELMELDAHPVTPPEPGEIKRLQSALEASRANLENLQKQVENLGKVQAPRFFPVMCPAFPGLEKPCPNARGTAIQGQKAAAPSKIEKTEGYVKNEKENVDRLEKALQEAQSKEAYPQKRQDLAAKITMLKTQATATAELDQKIAGLDSRMKTGQELLDAVRTFWREKNAFDAAVVKSARAEKEAGLYDVLAKALAANGIPSKMIVEALKPLNELLQLAAAHLFPGRALMLNRELGIELSGTPYVILSKSAKFRVGVAFQYALAKLGGARLLMIDEADILDPGNRGQLIKFLVKIKQDFDNILLFATTDNARASLSPDIQVWVLLSGKIYPLNQGFHFKDGKIIPEGEDAAQKMAA